MRSPSHRQERREEGRAIAHRQCDAPPDRDTLQQLPDRRDLLI
jgi:hypothetical protein